MGHRRQAACVGERNAPIRCRKPKAGVFVRHIGCNNLDQVAICPGCDGSETALRLHKLMNGSHIRQFACQASVCLWGKQ